MTLVKSVKLVPMQRKRSNSTCNKLDETIKIPKMLNASSREPLHCNQTCTNVRSNNAAAHKNYSCKILS